MPKDLFGIETPTKRGKRNPYHACNGKFTSKDISRAEHAENRLLIAQNRIDYLESLHRGTSYQLRSKDEKIKELEINISELKNKINQILNK